MNSATEGPRNLGFVLSEGNGAISYESVTIASGSGRLQPGTVLGKITASGKYAPSPAAEVEGQEGAETACAVLGYRVDATGADAEAVILRRHAEVKMPMLIFDDSVTDEAAQLLKLEQLQSSHIIAR